MIKHHIWFRWTTYVYLGITLFALSFIIAASLYPGGSDADSHDTAYRLHTNYWCELMGKYGKNGHKNNGRFIGIAGMFSLCSGVILFWLKFPTLTVMSTKCKMVTRFCGSTSMFLAFFIFFYRWHDALVALSVTLGTFAFICSLVYFKRQKNGMLYAGCVISLLLIYANAFIYMSKWMIQILPMLQKITFLVTLSWIALTLQRIPAGQSHDH